MTITDLQSICAKAINEGKGNFEVVFDTEAVCFNTHAVRVSRAFIQDDFPEELGKYLILNYDMSKEDISFFREDTRVTVQK